MKPLVLVAVVVFSQFLFAAHHTPGNKDHNLQVLYSELKYIESESFRVVVTIEILEERFFEPPLPEDPEELFLQLESLYKYYAELDAYQRELQDQWNRLLDADDGAPVTFNPDQFKKIPIISNQYLSGLPETVTPLSESFPIPVR